MKVIRRNYVIPRFFKKLNDEEVEYLIACGFAVNLYGYIRATMDLNILIMLNKVNINKLIKIK